MRKSNIRSIRFTDELVELIDRQVGDTFTARLENLVTRCVWELPERERQLAELDRQIAVKRKELMRLNEKAVTLRRTLGKVEGLVANIQTEIIRAVKEKG